MRAGDFFASVDGIHLVLVLVGSAAFAGSVIYWHFFVTGSAHAPVDYRVRYDDREIRQVIFNSPEGRKFFGLCETCTMAEPIKSQYKDWQLLMSVRSVNGSTGYPQSAIFVNCKLLDCPDGSKDPRTIKVKELAFSRLGKSWLFCEGVDGFRLNATVPEGTCYNVLPNGTRVLIK